MYTISIMIFVFLVATVSALRKYTLEIKSAKDLYEADQFSVMRFFNIR